MVDEQPRDAQAPKGRPTPKRSEAQSARRKAAATGPMDRKTAARKTREARRADMAKQREALAGGDERYLPARDKGQVRKFIRDYVDSRTRFAEFFLPLAVVILILSAVGGMQDLMLLLWLVVIVGIVVDTVIMVVRMRGELRRRFPKDTTPRTTMYAITRSLQMRRLRLPKPQVTRGTKL
nr:DUF3043 domain-containing protein [Actinacidiphila yeochonensis]